MKKINKNLVLQKLLFASVLLSSTALIGCGGTEGGNPQALSTNPSFVYASNDNPSDNSDTSEPNSDSTNNNNTITNNYISDLSLNDNTSDTSPSSTLDDTNAPQENSENEISADFIELDTAENIYIRLCISKATFIDFKGNRNDLSEFPDILVDYVSRDVVRNFKIPEELISDLYQVELSLSKTCRKLDGKRRPWSLRLASKINGVTKAIRYHSDMTLKFEPSIINQESDVKGIKLPMKELIKFIKTHKRNEAGFLKAIEGHVFKYE
jgi:hypothetical protein